ncbi:MAG: hypothetical protein V1908_02210, partial [Candidatus Peregrinibacteria bacterium]
MSEPAATPTGAAPAVPQEDIGKVVTQVVEGLKESMAKPTLGNVLNALGPLLTYYLLNSSDTHVSDQPNSDDAREHLRTEVDQSRLGALRAQVARQAPFLMAEKPPGKEEKKAPKTKKELAMIEDLKKRGFVYDYETGNYLDPAVFPNMEQLRFDFLLPYELYDGSGALVTCYFRKSFGD